MFNLNYKVTPHKSTTKTASDKRVPPEGPQTESQFTSVQQIFHLEILLIRLFGGYLFDWSNRKLAIFYRLFAPLIWAHIVRKYLIDFSYEEDRRAILFSTIPQNTLKIQLGIETIMGVVLPGFTFALAVLDIYHHDTIRIIVSKRLDIDYVQGYKSFETSSIKLVKCVLIAWTFLFQPLSHLILAESWYYVADHFKRNSTASSAGNGVNLRGSDKQIFQVILDELARISTHALKREVHQLWVVGYFLGPVYMHLMIVATMTDMLKRAKLNSLFRSKPTTKQNYVKQVQVTQLLVHIRDVLVILRQTTGKGYVVGIGLVLTIMSAAPSWALNYNSAGHHMLTAVVIIWALLYFSFIVASMHITKRLHEAAEEIADRNQPQLVGWSSRFYIEHQTRMKLADEISKIWATDWFKPDIRWLLKTCASLFVLVVGLHQIVEKRFQKE